MSDYDPKQYILAIEDFRKAHRKAALESIISSIRGKSTDLIAYEQVRENLRPIESARRILEEIPLEKIVGSVNRTNDFTRSFLPKQVSDAHRWARVRTGVDSMAGLPPIEAYRVGDLYFILDGHHRVSVARELGQETIQGYVTPVFTRVPLSPDDSADDLIIKAEYTDFLSETKIDDIRPGANLMVSVPGQYKKLREHINVHRYFMGLEQSREISEQEAIQDWYDNVYSPVAQVIRDRNLLQDFPERTEADLYLWIMDHRIALSQGEIGWEISPGKAASDLVNRYSTRPQSLFPRVGKKILNLLLPETLEPGPPVGMWRCERQAPHRGDRLFDDILVTIPDGKSEKYALDLAVELASREQARLTGLHVLSKPGEKDETSTLKASFLASCEEKKVVGRFLTDAGQAAHLICQRSAYVDLVVFRLAHPPSSKILKRLRSGVRYMMRHCASPVFAVPNAPFNLDSALLAFGPGRMSEEALFVAAYLAGCWRIGLTVVSAIPKLPPGSSSPNPLDRARSYLGTQGIEATYILEETDYPAQAVLLNAERQNVGFIITGSYESTPLRESFLGSNVNQILRSTRRPVLVCR